MRALLKSFAWMALFCLLLLPAPALAGGWAVVTLDSLPGEVSPGEPFTLGFFVRQHGVTPFNTERILVTAFNEAEEERLEWFARPDGEPGHYTVEMTFPTPGRWSWGIVTGFYPEAQPMPVITVAEGAPASRASFAAGGSLPYWIAGLALLGGALLSLRLGRRRWSLALGLTALLAVLAGLLAVPALQTTARGQTAPETYNGQELFTAKGCVVCHSHARAEAQASGISTGAGPGLSTYHADPGFLRSWLKNPASTRSNATMPNLGLEEGEIEALIAFLNAE